jgi:hypothetical protein
MRAIASRLWPSISVCGKAPVKITPALGLALGLVLGLGAFPLLAQAPDLSGTWKLDKGASQLAAGAGLAMLGAGGAPNTMYITLAANGTLTIGSDHNQSMARAYVIGGESSIPIAPSQTMTVRSRWEMRTLIIEAVRPDVPGTGYKETFMLDREGQTLTVTVTVATPQAPTTTTLVYTRSQSESPCTSWPTPCRS